MGIDLRVLIDDSDAERRRRQRREFSMSEKQSTKQYDGIVIGTGQGGKPLAANFARAGWNMAIVECGAIGGTCVNVGCTPTKTMVASARVAYLASRGAEYGVGLGKFTMDMSVVRERKRKIVHSFSSGSEKGLERIETLDLIRGMAKFVDALTLEVALNDGGTRTISSDKIFINVGARPTILKIPGIDGVDALTSSSIMELDSVPEHLIVIGGGYIGLEFGQMFRRFGSQVTVVNRGAKLVGREDDDVADAVAEILTGEGMTIELNCSPTKAHKDSDGSVVLTVSQGGEEREIRGSHVLMAAGRTSNADRLNLSAAGIDCDKRGYIPVNGKLETNISGVYALGDINGGPAFTHIAYDDFRILRTNLLENGSASTEGRMVPYTMFIDPQLARVGLSEREAKEAGIEVRVAKIPMTHVARALEMDETRGFMKALVDPKTDLILGAMVLGVEGGEVMSVLQMAMMGAVPYTKIRDGVFAHPTLAESLNNLFMSLG